jgi:hypothetical protein
MGADLDGWIAKVRTCEYLPENDLKQLCQMVSCGWASSPLRGWCGSECDVTACKR